MIIDADTKLYCLIGNPISKSLSPLIHNYIFKFNSINAKYLAFNINSNYALEKAICGFKALEIKGFNVTMPFKIEIMKYLDEIDEKAKILGAVNTVLNIDGKLIGYNTDGDGFIKSLKNKNIYLRDKKVAIIGAGGVAHSIAVSLCYEGIKELIIINRNQHNAHVLQRLIVDKFSDIDIKSYGFEEKAMISKDIELLVNATPVGMYPNLEDIPISPSIFTTKTIFYDTIYKPYKTRLVLEAEKLGHKSMGGLDMLVNQAIYSQEIWNKGMFDENTDWSYIKDLIVGKVKD
ncbi:MAG: shikimate dehydrogenase [Tissierellales bacterium]